MILKECIMCLEEKPLEAFHKSSTGKHGRHGYCRPCAKTYNRTYFLTRHERQELRETLISIDAEPASDDHVRERFVRLYREKQEEGPKRCEYCTTRLRLGNRKRGVCERCHVKRKAEREEKQEKRTAALRTA